jgi:hypothetical protein
MDFGVLYLPYGWQRECADEAQARDAYDHAPQGEGDLAQLIIDGDVVSERATD